MSEPTRGDRDTACVAFLRWALPQMGMRWAGFRKVRRQVCRRVLRRAGELGLPDLAAYRTHLENHPDEWETFDGLACITISRFYRDKGVFAFLRAEVLPALASAARARSAATLRAWSAGCASGEEPYTLAIMWELSLAQCFPGLGLRVLATDIDPAMLRRARGACYDRGSLRDLPAPWRHAAFAPRDGRLCLQPHFRQPVSVVHHDLRSGTPDGPFDLVLCRNLAFTYFDTTLQRDVLALLAHAVSPGGALVLGTHETLPDRDPWFAPWSPTPGVYHRTPLPATRHPPNAHRPMV